MKRHGMYGTPTYRAWAEMRTRTSNPRIRRFYDYGGRGIDCDPRWIRFEMFFDEMGEKPEGLTLERIDNSLGYWPSNCRWATCLEQANNKRNSRFVTVGGITKTVSQWALATGICRGTLQRRLKLGWEPEKFLSMPNPMAGRFQKGVLYR